VQVYRTDSELLESLAAFVADGIWQSERIVIIATPSHRAALQKALTERGVDLHAAAGTRQLSIFDAADMLEKFMVGERPNRDRFMSTIGEVVSQAVTGGRRLRAFGEMVALLWQRGKRQAALELEELWNELSRERNFSLFCAYPAEAVEGVNAGPSLADICRVHDTLIPAFDEERR